MCESERHTRGLLFQFQEVVVKSRHSTRLPILLFALNCGCVCHPRSPVRDSLPPSFKKKVAQHRSDREKMVPTRGTLEEKNPRSHRSLIERERQPRIFLLVRVNHAKKNDVFDQRAGTKPVRKQPSHVQTERKVRTTQLVSGNVESDQGGLMSYGKLLIPFFFLTAFFPRERCPQTQICELRPCRCVPGTWNHISQCLGQSENTRSHCCCADVLHLRRLLMKIMEFHCRVSPPRFLRFSCCLPGFSQIPLTPFDALL